MARHCEVECGAYIQPWNGGFNVEVIVFKEGGEPSSETSSHPTLREALKKLEEYFREHGE